jgi:hypothetical protein
VNRSNLIALVVTVGLLVGAFFVRKLFQSPAGERCTENSQCRSGMCVGDPITIGSVLHPRSSLCSDDCEHDADCPPHMICGTAGGGTIFQRACVHRAPPPPP